jgi:flavin reductase (DIM6/NTAB) family NADH-FMN oxidoreductase RutF
VDVDAVGDIFRRLDRELWLITARAGARRSGLIATYAASVSLVPSLPRVTIALAKHHFTHELIDASDGFVMHLISEEHVDWVWRFGIPSGRKVDKLDGLSMSTGASGAPIVSNAIAWLDCRVESRLDTGDRTIFLAEVLEARANRTSEPLTLNRMLELAPPERLGELKFEMDRDIELDRAAILEWRRKQGAAN